MISSISALENRLRHSRLALLLYLLILKAIILTVAIIAYDIHLAPDEAQYWAWSRELDWGYYSKPPAIAWQIWTTTKIFGHHELGVRAGAIVISFLLALAVYNLSEICRLSLRVSFWSGVAMAFCPLGIFFSFAATTDAGATLFLTLAISEVARGFEQGKSPQYPLAGVWILLGALYKWTAFILWPVTLLMMLFYKPLRRLSFLWGVIISLLSLLPSLYWNASHDWVTFKHVGTSLIEVAHAGNPIDFLFSQIALLSPIFFFLLIISYFYIQKPRLMYLGLFPFLIFFYFVSSFFKKLQPNWGDFLYPPAMVLIAWVSLEKIHLGRLWLHMGAWLSILGTCGALAIPWIQSHNVFSDYQISYRANPFRQNVGWDQLEGALTAAGYRPNQDFLFGDRYQTTSLLKFYGPAQQPIYYFNINRERRNHFSYEARMEDHEAGKTGYLVLIKNGPTECLDWFSSAYPEKITPYFKQVTYAGSYPLFTAYGAPVKHALIFRCEDYLGLAPEDPKEY